MPSQIVQINYDFTQHGSNEKFITQHNINLSFNNSPTAALNLNYDVADDLSYFMQLKCPCLRHFSKMTHNLPG